LGRWRLLRDMSSFENSTVLLVSADVRRSAFLSDQLGADGFDVIVADDAAMGTRALERTYPDLVAIDARLPDASGLAVVRAIREADAASSRVDPQTPVMVLVDGERMVDRVRALERGADDAITAALDYAEVVARMRALLRRSQRRGRRGQLRVGPLHVDPVSRDVAIGTQPVELSQKEFLLLQVLASEPTRVFSKEELLRSVWGFRTGAGRTRTLDSHACRLRQKLCVDGARFVVNVWGVGYRLVDGPVEPAASPPVLSLVRRHALVAA
jgi:DNA-binding response OmpR family regulator